MRREWVRFAWAIGFGLLLTSIPSLYGCWNVPSESSWTGMLTRNTADVNGYLGIIEEIRQGHLRTRNLFTAEPHPPFQVRPYYMLLGLMGRLFPAISTVTWMEIGRFISVATLLILTAIIVRRLFSYLREQLLAFFVVCFGSGLGWTFLVNDPPDLRIVETSTFLTLLSPPLYSISLSLVVGILLLLDSCWRVVDQKRAFRFAGCAGILAMWLGFDRPFSIATIGLTVGGLFLIETIRDRRISIRILLSFLPVLLGAAVALSYQLWCLQNIEVYAEWNRQHYLLSPELHRLLFALGLLLPLAFLGVRLLFRSRSRLSVVLCCYAVSSLILSHLPVQFQERFLEGLPLSVSLPAASGLITLLNRIHQGSRWILSGMVCVFVLSVSSAVVFVRDCKAIGRQSAPQYMLDPVLNGMRELAKLARPEEAIFSAEATGNFIAAYAARPVVLGHRIQTSNYGEKRLLVLKFFQTQAKDPLAEELFRKSRARWLFWGHEEARLAKDAFEPKQAPFLQKEYSNEFVTLYRLR